MKKIVQLVVSDDTGDTCYRMRWPAEALAIQEPTWQIVNLNALAANRHQLAVEADLLVIYQSHDQSLFPVLEARRKQGKRTLVEYNDNFYAPPPASPVGKEWSSPLLWQIYERFMLESDGVIVTGPGLKELLSQKIDREFFVLENHLPSSPPPLENLLKNKTKNLSLGWAGSVGHMSDFLAVLPVIRELLLEIPELEFHVMGNETIPQLLRLPADRFRFLPWGPMEKYYEFWESVHIGFAPLLDTAYNRCRSDIKAIEMASRAVLPIPTNLLPYQEFIRETGVPSFSNFGALKKIIAELSKSREKIQKLSAGCYEYVNSKRVNSLRLERRELYRRFLEGTAQVLGPNEAKPFTQDLRLWLASVNSLQEFGQRRVEWRKLLDHLEGESELYQDFFAPGVVALICQELVKQPKALEEALRVLALYPNSAELRFVIAEHLERSGDFAAALAHFEWLSKSEESFRFNHKFLSSTSTDYLRTWEVALKGRLE